MPTIRRTRRRARSVADTYDLAGCIFLSAAIIGIAAGFLLPLLAPLF